MVGDFTGSINKNRGGRGRAEPGLVLRLTNGAGARRGDGRDGSSACLLKRAKRITSLPSRTLVVTALAPVLRGLLGRNPGDNDDTTWHLSGRSVRVLAFGLAFLFPAKPDHECSDHEDDEGHELRQSN
jgi:hypothetical protein